MERSKFTMVNMFSMHINNFFFYFIYFSYSLRNVYFLGCLYLGLLHVGTSLFPPGEGAWMETRGQGLMSEYIPCPITDTRSSTSALSQCFRLQSICSPLSALFSASAGCRCARFWRHWMMHGADVVSTCFIRCYQLVNGM